MVGTLVGGCRCAASWCDLDLTFDLAIVTKTFKILSGYFLDYVRCAKLSLSSDIGWRCRCVHLPYLRHVSLMIKIYELLPLIIICAFT